MSLDNIVQEETWKFSEKNTSRKNRLPKPITLSIMKNAYHNFPEHNMTQLNCLFCTTNGLKPKDI